MAKNDIVPTTETAIANEDPRVKELQKQIDLSDTNSIISFGAEAQKELQAVSQQMIGDVKNKDAGPAGESIRAMVVTIRGFTVGKGDLRQEPNFVERILGRVAPIANFAEKYNSVRDQIDLIRTEMEGHRDTMMEDNRNLDVLYRRTVDFYESLGTYIQAGRERLKQANDEDIPALEAKMQAADEQDAMIVANDLRDLRAATADLERRVTDLQLTRQVTMQSLPSIRMIQDGNKSLVTKITSTLSNMIPLWETQMAQAITINRSAKAALAVQEASDLTNEMLVSNANNLRLANKRIRTETERGVFDVKAVQQANQTLLATFEDSLKIADKGRADRLAAEKTLDELENKLKQGLLAASAKDISSPGM